MKFYKKGIAIFTVSSMLVSGGCVMADDYSSNTGEIKLDKMSVTGNGIKVNDSIIEITQGGDFTVTGEATDVMIKVNTEDKVKLRLSGMNLANSTGPAIFFENCDKALITVTENTENYVSDGVKYSVDAKAAIFSNDDLEIKGNGTLFVTGNYKHAIASDDDIQIENGVLNLEAKASDGIHANNDINILGGEINILAASDGVQAETNVLIEDGLINITQCEEGIESGGTITVNGGEINVNASDDGLNSGGGVNDGNEMPQMPISSGKGIREGGNAPQKPSRENVEIPQSGRGGKGMINGNGKTPQKSFEENGTIPQPPAGGNGEMPPMPMGGKGGRGGRAMNNNGEVPPMPIGENGEMPQLPTMENGEMPPMPMGGRGGMIPNSEEAEATSIFINGGIIKINASGDGIDANGNIYIKGGEIYVDGPENNGNGAIDCYSMIIDGGNVIAVGSSGMAMSASSESKQCTIKVGFETQEAGAKLVLKNENTEIMSYTADKKISSLVYSSDTLKEGEIYELYINDELIETIEMTSAQVNVGTNGRGMGGGMFGGGNRGNKGQQNKNSNNRIKVKLNDKEIKFDAEPIIQEDTTLVPLRGVLESLGLTVEWDSNEKKITATKDDIEITLKIGSKSAKVNSKELSLLTAPVISEDRTLVPIRFIAESLNLNVGWDSETKTVSITE